jgi:oligosaccharyltransferase complex subunit alpha (ribophorin I)
MHSIVKVNVPFALDKSDITKTYTYLDTIGRTMLVLEKHNVIDEHQGPIEIEYEFPTMMLLLKPAAVSIFLLGIFAVFIVWARLDFSIVKVQLPFSYWRLTV